MKKRKTCQDPAEQVRLDIPVRLLGCSDTAVGCIYAIREGAWARPGEKAGVKRKPDYCWGL